MKLIKLHASVCGFPAGSIQEVDDKLASVILGGGYGHVVHSLAARRSSQPRSYGSGLDDYYGS